MPKQKTRKSLKKRVVGKTADQLLRLRKMSVQHRARFKSKRARQAAGQTQQATRTISKKLAKLLH